MPCPRAERATRRRCSLAALACALALAWPGAHAAEPDKRIALVIGNGNYREGALRNPPEDARAVARALRELGFEVTLRENARLDGMLDALQAFSLAARDARVRVLYYAGHGVQVRGHNYLVPVDAELRSEDDVRGRTADVSAVLERLRTYREGVDILILDACRTTPFSDKLRLATRGLGSKREGLAGMAAPSGALIAYSTSPDAVAQDGTAGNSVYTRHLLAHIGTAGLPVEQLFKRVRAGVARETGNGQIPWEASSLTGDFCFRPGSGGRCGDSDAAALVPTTVTIDTDARLPRR